MRTRNRAGQSGVTLLEVAAAVAALGAVFLVSSMATRRSLESWRESDRTAELERKCQQVADTLGQAFADAGGSTLVPVPVGTTPLDRVSFQAATGISAGAATWGSAQTIEWRPAPGEPENGADDDGDGMVDEGEVVWVRDISRPAATTVVVARDVPALGRGETGNGDDDDADGLVDERGFSVSAADGGLRIRIEIARSTPGGVIVAVAERAVALRN